MKHCTILDFPSKLGWMAIAVADATVRRLTFGHRSAASARAALSMIAADRIPPAGNAGRQARAIARRLQAYAAGRPDEFIDVAVDLERFGEFQQRVLNACRRIHYGSTISYAELAALAGSPNAARAVGNCMAANPIPLLIPCHRVVRADGGLGAYSAIGGAHTKRYLLAMESRVAECHPL